jgi:BNR/Asp-box repeat
LKKANAVLICALFFAALLPAVQAGAASNHMSRSRFFLSDDALKNIAPRGTAANGFLPSSVECQVKGQPNNLNLDCDDPQFESPNNEPHIVVDPRNPQHMVASSNDYESCCDQWYTTFDGGRTWTTGDMSAEDPNTTGSDPVTAIDPKTGNVIHSSLNYTFTSDGQTTRGDVVVSISKDGGITWGQPVIVQHGMGADLDPLQFFNDKEWVVTDTNPQSPHYGRTYLTWTRFRSEFGVEQAAPIFEAHSDDGGETWSHPQEISGTSPTCTFQLSGGGNKCDEDQASMAAIAPNGTVYVSFLNGQHQAAWENGETGESQYMVVRSTDGGQTWSNPVHVADMEDGSRDFPLNVDGRQTLSHYQVRVWGAGALATDPRNGRLYLVFMDNRAGRHDVEHPVTNTNVYISTSEHGTHWSRPTPVSTRRTDQWFPSVSVNPVNGTVGVLYHSRTEDNRYATVLAQGRPGDWHYRKVSNAGSHPRNSLYFRAGAEHCFKCATFHGDYISVAYGKDGKANAVWTDMRRFIDLGVPGGQGYAQNIFFSRI